MSPSSFWEINEIDDWRHTGPGTKLIIGREFLRKYCSNPKSVGMFGWALVQKLYTPEEREGRNYLGNASKLPLSPRRRRAIEEAFFDTYGPNPKLISEARTSINSNIRDKKYRLEHALDSKRKKLFCDKTFLQMPSIYPGYT